MAYKDLTFLLFAKDMSASRGFEKVARSADGMAKGVSGAMLGTGVAIAGLAIAGAAASVKLAADFETATTRIITDGGGAGESVAQLQSAIMKSAGSTGTSLTGATAAMYKLSSAGITLKNGGGAALQAALEGAKIGGADAVTVADALSTVMTDFGPKAGTAAKAMSMLTATVSTGKTNLGDLAGSLHSVLPAAAAAHLGLAEVLAAVGTMTAEGVSADQATQNLNHSILSLQAPSQVAKDAMAGVGVSSLDVAKNLGKRGLAGTYGVLFSAMAKHSKAGMVVVNTFAQSAQASSAMKAELAGMPPALAATARGFAAGHLTSKEWAATLKGYPATVANLGKQFATNTKHATGFSAALKSGEGPVRTQAGQLEKMLGGTTGLQTALHLTGDHMKDFVKNTKIVGGAAVEAGNHVRGWGDTQKTFNQKLAVANEAFQLAGAKIGQALMPAVEKLLPILPKIAKSIALWAPQIAKFAGWLVDTIDAFRNGADQWHGIFLAIGKWFKDTVAAFASGWKQITGFFTGAVKNFANGGKQLNDFFHGIEGWVRDLVHSFGNGWTQIVHGVTGTWNTIIGAFRNGWKQITGFFAGAGGWLLDAGRSIIEGLVNGIKAGERLITGAVTWLSSLIPAGVKKFLNINSPSKVMIPIGASVGEGLAVGVLGSAKQVQSATKSLTTMVIGMFDKGTVGAGTESRALRTIRTGTATLIAEANKRAAIGKQITAAEKKLATDLKAQKKASDSSLRDSVMSDGDVTKFAAPGDAIQGLQALLGNTRRFKTDLQRLVKKGIDSNTLKQLIGAGVNGGGLTMADELLANPTDFKEIVTLQKQLASSAGSLASYAGNVEYGSTIRSDRSNLAKLKGAQRVETWRSQHTAAGMVNAIAKETHVHIHLTGHYAGTKDDLAKSVTTAIRDAVRRGQLPKNVLTAL